MKKFISILLLLATLLSCFMIACDNGNPDDVVDEEQEEVIEHPNENVCIRGAEDVVYSVETVDGRKYINFGMYPQTKVEDPAILVGLSAYATNLPSSMNANGWTVQKIPNEYGVNLNAKSDYSFYKDVVYEGAYYRAMYFTEYRIYNPGSVTIWDSVAKDWYKPWGPTCQLTKGYAKETVFWFKYEPIKWEVLQENKSTGEMFVFSDLCIDSNYWGYDGTNIINNYEKSSVRAFLNDDFLYYAFTKAEREMINQKVYRNDGASTCMASNTNAVGVNNTNDKVALISLEEVTRQIYGFDNTLREMSNGSSQCFVADVNRQKKGTDYANCQGNYKANDKDWMVVNYWTRSPGGNQKTVVYVGGNEGVTDDSQYASCLMGIAPVMYVKGAQA